MCMKLKFGCWIGAGSLAHLLFFSSAFAQENNVVTNINGTPICSSASFDSDGDGWGWERNRSCIVSPSDNSADTGESSQNITGNTDPSRNTTSRHPDCSSADFDFDGDGFGWENHRVCVVVNSSAPSTVTTAPSTVTNAPSTGSQLRSTHPICSGADADPDGDGFGWENNRSCVVAETDGTADQINAKTPATAAAVPGTTRNSGHPECIDPNSDPDGDGFGWEFNRSCEVVQNSAPVSNNNTADANPVVTPDATPVDVPDVTPTDAPVVTPDIVAKTGPTAAPPVITPNGFNPFSKFQLGNSLYTNNVYDNRQWDFNNNGELIYYNGVQDFVRWNVPALIENDPNPCVRTQSDEPLTLSYRLTSLKDSPTARNTFVRAYPAMVVGTMGGRFESWGVECGALRSLQTSAQRHGSSPIFQMETVAAATGLPVKAGQLDFDVRVSVKADLLEGDATNGVANVFLDSYWHDA